MPVPGSITPGASSRASGSPTTEVVAGPLLARGDSPETRPTAKGVSTSIPTAAMAPLSCASPAASVAGVTTAAEGAPERRRRGTAVLGDVEPSARALSSRAATVDDREARDVPRDSDGRAGGDGAADASKAPAKVGTAAGERPSDARLSSCELCEAVTRMHGCQRE